MGRRKRHVLKAEDERALRLAAPGLFSDLAAGRLGSSRKALELAGLRDERSRLEKLQNSWNKAEDGERAAFLDWLMGRGELPCETATFHGIADGRYLRPQAIHHIEAIMRAKGMTPERLMAEIGFPGEGKALLRAMARASSLRLKIIRALAVWLEAERDKR
ncbi:hypothetical protein [Allorhizobium undicola]|uniref:hypothetical protein n=1 Tax=Allorhizobium undicola TaxID=78527 RepID=UPI00056B191C|nr:hypothetical protein [Allorhizobium undicola]